MVEKPPPGERFSSLAGLALGFAVGFAFGSASARCRQEDPIVLNLDIIVESSQQILHVHERQHVDQLVEGSETDSFVIIQNRQDKVFSRIF